MMAFWQWLYNTDYDTFRTIMGMIGQRAATLICKRLGVDY